jgi:Na+/H+ antiporter NhaC
MHNFPRPYPLVLISFLTVALLLAFSASIQTISVILPAPVIRPICGKLYGTKPNLPYRQITPGDLKR